MCTKCGCTKLYYQQNSNVDSIGSSQHSDEVRTEESMRAKVRLWHENLI